MSNSTPTSDRIDELQRRVLQLEAALRFERLTVDRLQRELDLAMDQLSDQRIGDVDSFTACQASAATSFLVPEENVAVIAIDNKSGLKYFDVDSCTEDW